VISNAENYNIEGHSCYWFTTGMNATTVNAYSFNIKETRGKIYHLHH
jgi:hypothetical protein